MKEYAITTGLEAQAVSSDQFATLDLALIVTSLTNPRKNFNPVKLQELADSIAATGVHQPILVRPLPGARLADTFRNRGDGAPLPEYELVAGERRYRASKMAGAAAIPAMIRTLTDGQVLEIQLLENLQRDDLHPMEEAEGYEALCVATGITKEKLGDKIGKSRAYVYGRLKLLDLTSQARRAFVDGLIDAGRALIIARVPDTELQLKTLAEALHKDYQGDVPSLRELQRWAQQNVMLRLDRAKFDIKDISLIDTAGACTSCDKRTGAAPDLFSDVDSADVCIDTKCFHGKEAAHDEITLAAATAKGQQVLEGNAAKKALESQYKQGADSFRRLDKPDYSTDGKKLLKTLIGKDAPVPVLVRDPDTNELIEMLPAATVNALLESRGVIDPKVAKQRRDEVAQLEKAKIEDKANKLWRKRAVEACHAEIDKSSANLIFTPILRLLAKMALRGLTADHREQVTTLLEIGKVGSKDGIADYIDSGGPHEVTTALLVLLMQHDIDHNPYGGVSDPVHITALAEELGVDLVKIKTQAKADVQPKVRTAEKSGKATNPTDPNPSIPAAQKSATPKAARGNAKQKAPAFVPAAKLTPAEASQGIAAAMQSLAGPDDGTGATGESPWAVGMRVKVNDTCRHPVNSKLIGSMGRLSQPMGDAAWMVVFTGKRGKVANFVSFDRTELELVA